MAENNPSKSIVSTLLETVVDDNLAKKYKTIELDFTLSDEVYREMEVWQKMWEHNDVDIVLCPLPMIQALEVGLLMTPFRAVRMKDRIAKTVSCNTFTI